MSGAMARFYLSGPSPFGGQRDLLRLRPRTNLGAAVRAAYLLTQAIEEAPDNEDREALARYAALVLARVEATDTPWWAYPARKLAGFVGLVRDVQPISDPDGSGSVEAWLRAAEIRAMEAGATETARLAREILSADPEPEPLDAGGFAAWRSTAGEVVRRLERYAGSIKDTGLDLTREAVLPFGLGFTRTVTISFAVLAAFGLLILAVYFGGPSVRMYRAALLDNNATG